MNWKIIGRGFNGWHADNIQCSSSGGSLENYTYWTGEKCKGYLAEAEDGCYYYDARHLDNMQDYKPFMDFILTGPAVDVKMPPNTGRGYNNESEPFVPNNKYYYVSPDVYIRLLREKVPNIITGRVFNNTVTLDSPLASN